MIRARKRGLIAFHLARKRHADLDLVRRVRELLRTLDVRADLAMFCANPADAEIGLVI